MSRSAPVTGTMEAAMEFENPVCESCEEPVTVDRPGSNWMCHSTEASIFPYNGARYSIVVHDGDEPYDCIGQYFEDNPDARGEFDSSVEVLL